MPLLLSALTHKFLNHPRSLHVFLAIFSSTTNSPFKAFVITLHRAVLPNLKTSSTKRDPRKHINSHVVLRASGMASTRQTGFMGTACSSIAFRRQFHIAKRRAKCFRHSIRRFATHFQHLEKNNIDHVQRLTERLITS